MDNNYGTFCMVHALLADRSNKYACKSAVAPRSDDEEVGGIGSVEKRACRVSFSDQCAYRDR